MIGSNRKKEKKRAGESSSGLLDDTFEQSNPMYDNDDIAISSSFTSPQKRGSLLSLGSAESQKSRSKSISKINEEYNIYTKDINRNRDDNETDNIEKVDDKDKSSKNENANDRRIRSTESSIISTDNGYADIEEKPLLKQPYVIIISVLVVWAMYATLYIAQELTSKCSWGYFVLLTMYVQTFFHLTE